MSIRENIELFGNLDSTKYLDVLNQEFRAQKHPAQEDALIVDGLPFYEPKDQDDHISILGFNKIPLPYSLLQALIEHRELASDDTIVRWTQEQELILESTLGELRDFADENERGVNRP
jgi:hypothetical protein